jgi:hypothetical protein
MLPTPPDPFLHPLDAILADIAINIQLPPGHHRIACDRYESVRTYIERAGSPLEDKVAFFYPQGSMSIDATISTRGTDDEYDLDVVAQLVLDPYVAPDVPLDLLEQALKGYPVEKPVVRQTRCITINYADGMHVDVTPGVRLRTSREQESHVFHANRRQPASAHFHVPMNAFGFALWYAERTPTEDRFAFELARRYYDAAGIEIRAAAEHDEVPDPDAAHRQERSDRRIAATQAISKRTIRRLCGAHSALGPAVALRRPRGRTESHPVLHAPQDLQADCSRPRGGHLSKTIPLDRKSRVQPGRFHRQMAGDSCPAGGVAEPCRESR